MVGEAAERKDALAKACGAERYIGDREAAGALTAVTVRSPVPRGRIAAIRFDPAFDWSRVVRLTAADLPGRNKVAMIREDYPALADGTVNFVGEAVCLLAAEDEALARAALSRVRVDYERLPPVLTIDEALARTELIAGQDNLLHECRIRKGDAAAALAAADVVVEGEYETGPAEHAYLEPNGLVAFPLDGGGVRIVGSIQCPFYVREAVRKALDVEREKVVVVQAPTGGAFGGKEDFPSVLAVHAAFLARAAGRPVKLFYERSEDIVSSSKRHPSRVRHATGLMRDGALAAMRIEVILDGGAYATMSPVVLQRGAIHAAGPYRCPNVDVWARAVATNRPPRGAFRGFGAPQTAFAVERQMDRAAQALGMDPLEIRRRNALRVGDTTATGQLLTESVSAGLVLDRCASLSRYAERWRECRDAAARPAPRGRRRGIGISLFWHGTGFTGSGELKIRARAAVRIAGGGERVEVLAGITEMGQGFSTVISQIAATALEIPLAMVSHAVPDTSDAPDSGPTVASRSTFVAGSVVQKACAALLEALAAGVAAGRGLPREAVSYRGGIFTGPRGEKLEDFAAACARHLAAGGAPVFEEGFLLPEGHCWRDEEMEGDAYVAYSWAADAVEVEVDMDTFEVTPTKATLVFDAGTIVNPQTATGQLEGGTLQSLGWGSIEEIKEADGRLLNDRFTTYMIPTAADCPEFETRTVEVPSSHGPFGAKGLGEIPYNGAAAALAAAIENATGIRVTRIPATPERLLEEREKTKGKGE